jgi:uncharacterized protein YcbX
MSENIKITGLHIYPVKSLAGISLKSSEIDTMGLKYDRRWMIVSLEGKFITQRNIPKMAAIKTALHKGRLTLTMEGKGSHLVPETQDDSSTMEVEIWRDKVVAQIVGETSDTWLSDALGTSCHLVYIDDDEVRGCIPEYSKKTDRMGFADAFPILVISEESLADLNQRLANSKKTNIPMERFRPNIVVSGCYSYEEDTWGTFAIGKISFRGALPCQRCIITTVDQETGKRKGKEPLETLADYRMLANNIYFGMHVIHEHQGVIKIGDKVVVDED